MAQQGWCDWPPAPLTTERLVLRESEPRDRSAVIDLFASPEVFAHIGGPQPSGELERSVPEVPGKRPGFFIVELCGAMIGIVTLDRRDPERPGHVRACAASGEIELGYMFLSQAWACGYATEACAAALAWFAEVFPGESVLLSARTANNPSVRVAVKLGFVEVEQFEEYGAQQWFGVWSPTRRLFEQPNWFD